MANFFICGIMYGMIYSLTFAQLELSAPLYKIILMTGQIVDVILDLGDVPEFFCYTY